MMKSPWVSLDVVSLVEVPVVVNVPGPLVPVVVVVVLVDGPSATVDPEVSVSAASEPASTTGPQVVQTTTAIERRTALLGLRDIDQERLAYNTYD
jgi:hypothetical protein